MVFDLEITRYLRMKKKAALLWNTGVFEACFFMLRCKFSAFCYEHLMENISLMLLNGNGVNNDTPILAALYKLCC